MLHLLPSEVLDLILTHLRAFDLASLALVANAFRARDQGGLPLVHKAAKSKLIAKGGPEAAAKWR